MRRTNGSKGGKSSAKTIDTQQAAVATSTSFFGTYGVETGNMKRGMDQRSPHDDGRSKKPSFFSVNTQFNDKSTEEVSNQNELAVGKDAVKAQMKIAGQNYREMVRKHEEEERLEEEQEALRKKKREEELRRRSQKRHEYIHGKKSRHLQQEGGNDSGSESSDDDSEEEEKIIGDPGRGIEGDTKSCTSLRNTSNEEQEGDNGEEDWNHDTENEDEEDHRAPETERTQQQKNSALSVTTHKRSAEKQQKEETVMDEESNDSATVKDKPTRKKQTTITSLMGTTETASNNTISSNYRASSIKSNNTPTESNSSFRDIPTTPPRFKRVNTNSKNRRKCIRMASSGNGDKHLNQTIDLLMSTNSTQE